MNINLVKASATVITKRAAYYENLGTQLDKLKFSKSKRNSYN